MTISCATKPHCAPIILPKLLGFGDLTQIGIVAPDLEFMAAGLARALGAGHFKVMTMDAPDLFQRSYAGKREDWSAKVGVTWIGNTQLEVIQPLSGQSVFAEFLRRRAGRPGVQHVSFESAGYEDTRERLRRAGYPLVQQARMNAAGRIGILPIPRLPWFLAKRFGARCGFNHAYSALKVDFEVAKFPPGISAKLALRTAIAEQWIPSERPYCFEQAPDDGMLAVLDAIVILCEDVDAVAQAYGRLTDRVPEVESYEDVPLPGRGLMARMEAGRSQVMLVQPEDGLLAQRLAEHGEGIQLVGARTTSIGIEDVKEALADRGWAFPTTGPASLAVHEDVPFALWLEHSL